jgi:NADH-quinone oxidoreductase subunit E
VTGKIFNYEDKRREGNHRMAQMEDQQDFVVPSGLESEIDELITHYPEKRSASLMVLHALQEKFGYLSKQAIEWTAAKLDLEPVNIYELVTFYPMFRNYKVGTTVIRVCRTLSCALGGSHKLHGHLCSKLGLDPGEKGPQNTPDGKFTIEFAECLAACGTPPVMMCNDDFYDNVSNQEADKIIGKYQK